MNNKNIIDIFNLNFSNNKLFEIREIYVKISWNLDKSFFNFYYSLTTLTIE